MTRTRIVSRERYKVFMSRAEQFREAMNFSMSNGDFDACVSNAVHCGISASDALTVLKLGKKSAAQNHIEAVILLKEVQTSDDSEKAKVCDRLQELINLKTPAEYDDRAMSKSEAEKAQRLCNKVFDFVKKEMEKAEVLRGS